MTSFSQDSLELAAAYARLSRRLGIRDRTHSCFTSHRIARSESGD